MGRAILRVLLGVTLLASLAGAVYLIVATPPPAPVTAAGAPEQAIPRGYVGLATFGRWRLICTTGAPPPSAAQPASGARRAQKNQCRINHEVADRAKPGQVILAANLSVVGPAKRPALMLRLPPTARDGDLIFLRADDVTRVRVVVRGCSEAECVAAGELSSDDWNHVLGAKALQVAFPALNRHRVLVDIPVDGLADAAHAMALAQTTS
jgi:invasion protein IalB